MFENTYTSEYEPEADGLEADTLEDAFEAGATLLDEIVEEAFSPSGRRFNLENLLEEFEDESVGAISAIDYIKWVQRSLNRRYASNIPTDGKVSSAYRAAVRKFNQEYTGRDYDDVDEQTQNQLIYVNEVHSGYVKWVILALNAVGLGPLPYTATYTTAVNNAIKAFQRREGLKVDGYVGSKTELALIGATGKIPPGQHKPDPKPPKPPETTDWPAFLQTKLKQCQHHMEEYRSLWEDTLAYCMVRKLRRPAVDDRVIMPNDMASFFNERDDGGTPDISRLKRVMIEDLKKGLGRGKTEKFVARVDEIYRPNLVNALGVLARHKQFGGYDDRVPRTVRRLKEWSKNQNSVYHCEFLRQVIDDLASDFNIW
jgi:hypothetical protein